MFQNPVHVINMLKMKRLPWFTSLILTVMLDNDSFRILLEITRTLKYS